MENGLSELGRLERLRLLEAALSLAVEGVIVVDAEGRPVLINEAAKRLVRLWPPLADPLCVQVAEAGLRYLDGRPVPPANTPLRRALRGETTGNCDFILCGSDLTNVCATFSAYPVRDDGGRLIGAALVVRDVTELEPLEAQRERLLAELRDVNQRAVIAGVHQQELIEKAERRTGELQRLNSELMATAARISAIVDVLPEGVIVLDAKGRVTLINRAVREVVPEIRPGVRAAEVVRLALRHEDGRPYDCQDLPLIRALRGEAVDDEETSFTRPDGKRYDVLVRTVPLRNEQGQIEEVVAVFHDVTQLRELDRAREKFLHVAAHELRTPLTPIKGYAELLKRHLDERETPFGDQEAFERRTLETIVESCGVMQRLINDLLDASRAQVGQLRLDRFPVDLVAMVRRITEGTQLATETHVLEFESDVPQLVGHWDGQRLSQVLNNLLSNAVRHSPGGRIVVRVSREGASALVMVKDEGPGIPAEVANRLFQPFVRGLPADAPHTRGMGLGLYVCDGIVKAHGGRIWAESEPGKGSTFYFTLPLPEGVS